MKRCLMCRVMDTWLDPMPKELKKTASKAEKMLYYEAQDESYRRHKHMQYRNLLLPSLINFFLGIIIMVLIKGL